VKTETPNDKVSDCAPSQPSELARSVAGRSSSPSHCSATCQHRMGHYVNNGPRTSAEEYKYCGKKATHVANYPKNAPFYLCRKHAKSRSYVSELPNEKGQP